MKMATRQEFSYVNRYKVKHFFSRGYFGKLRAIDGLERCQWSRRKKKKDSDPLNRSRAYQVWKSWKESDWISRCEIFYLSENKRQRFCNFSKVLLNKELSLYQWVVTLYWWGFIRSLSRAWADHRFLTWTTDNPSSWSVGCIQLTQHWVVLATQIWVKWIQYSWQTTSLGRLCLNPEKMASFFKFQFRFNKFHPCHTIR